MKGYCFVKMFLLWLCFLMTISFAQNKVSTAVLDLDASGISQAEALIISDRLRSELVQLGRFDVFEREKMNQILSEQGFQMSGCTSNECVIEAGKLIGVRLMIAGSIGKIGNLHTVNTRLIDIQTGRVIRTAVDDCDCKIEDVLTKAIKRVAEKLTGERAVEKKPEVRKETKPKVVKPKKLFISPLAGYGFSDITRHLIRVYGTGIGYYNKKVGRIGIKWICLSPPKYEAGPIHNITLDYEILLHAYKKLVITPHIGVGMIFGRYIKKEEYWSWDYTYTYWDEYVAKDNQLGAGAGIGFEFNISSFMYVNIGYDYYLPFKNSKIYNMAALLKIGFYL
jgi:TolB-like protein